MIKLTSILSEIKVQSANMIAPGLLKNTLYALWSVNYLYSYKKSNEPFFGVSIYLIEDFIEKPNPGELDKNYLFGTYKIFGKEILFNLDDLTFTEKDLESSWNSDQYFNIEGNQRKINTDTRNLKYNLKGLKQTLIHRKLTQNEIDLKALKNITNSIIGKYKPASFKSNKFLADKKEIFKKAYEELKSLEKAIDPKKIEEEVNATMDFVISNTINFIEKNSNLQLSPEQISEIKVLSPSSIMEIEFIEDSNVGFVGDYDTAVTVNINYQGKSYNINNANLPVGYDESIDMLYFLSDSVEIEEFLLPLAKEYNIEIEESISFNEYKFENISKNPLIKFKAIYL